MKDKQTMPAKNRSNRNNKKSNWSNRSKNRNNKKFNRFIPTQEQRVDKELIQEVSVFLSLSPEIDDKVICHHYKITERQLDYIKKHKQNWEILDKITGKEV